MINKNNIKKRDTLYIKTKNLCEVNSFDILITLINFFV